MQAQSVRSSPNVALLIDGDNVIYTLLPALLREASARGTVVVQRVYGNWTQPSMRLWKEVAAYHQVELRSHEQNSPRKNATDITLAIEAMDLLYTGNIDCFCLVTGDSDFLPLVKRIRSAGCIVVGVGAPTTPRALRSAYTYFLSTKQLSSSDSSPTSVAQGGSTVQSQQQSQPMVLALLVEAYERQGTVADEWVRLSALGTTLKQLDPTFRPAVYGHKRLQALVEAYPDLFETCRMAAKGKPVLVRRRCFSPKKREAVS